MTHFGFTGTRGSMTPDQRTALGKYLLDVPVDSHLWHGCYVGSNEEVVELFLSVVSHSVAHALPGHIEALVSERAFAISKYRHEPVYGTVRNHKIVEVCSVLLATPCDMSENPSDVWVTIRFARKLGRPVVIFWPDGTVTWEVIREAKPDGSVSQE